MPDMIPVDSSLIAAVGYDAEEWRLYIEFKRNGAVWRYDDVDQSTADELREAVSIGKYFLRNIKGMYEETKISG